MAIVLHQYIIELRVICGVYYSSSNTRSVLIMRVTGAAAAEAGGGAQSSCWQNRLEALGRSTYACGHKLHTLNRSLLHATLRKGPFSEEEDALILQRRAEWEKAGDGLRGLWVALEEEMGRPSKNMRWATVLTKQTKATVFTPEMVSSFCIRSHQVELKGDI